MRAGLPIACMLAFTGTPIEQEDRRHQGGVRGLSAPQPIDQACEGRRDRADLLREARCAAQDRRARLWRMISAPSSPAFGTTRLEKLKRGYAASGEACRCRCPDRTRSPRISSALYRTAIEPNGFKAQIVTVSRDVAVTYIEKLWAMGAPECALIMSTSNDDPRRAQAHHLSKRERDDRISRFKKPGDPLKMLVVATCC